MGSIDRFIFRDSRLGRNKLACVDFDDGPWATALLTVCMMIVSPLYPSGVALVEENDPVVLRH